MRVLDSIWRFIISGILLIQFGWLHAQPSSDSDIILGLPATYFENPNKLLDVESDEPIPLQFYSDEALKLQLEWNASEDLLRTNAHFRDLSGLDRYFGIDSLEITPFTWSWVYLKGLGTDAENIRLKLRRPNSWIREKGLHNIGQQSLLHLSDIGIDGTFEVIDRMPNTFDTRLLSTHVEADGSRFQPIISLATIDKKTVATYKFSNGDKVEATEGHVIWSESQKKWVAIGTLELHEQVRTAQSETAELIEVLPISEPQTVYSIEVYRDHNYYVGEAGILVYNTCIGVVLRRLYPDATTFKSVTKRLTKSGAIKRFLTPDGKGHSEFGKRFMSLSLKQQEKLVKDIVSNPKLVHALADNPKLLKSWKKLGKHADLRKNTRFLDDIKDLDDAVLDVLNDVDDDLLRLLSKDLKSVRNGKELKGLLKTADDVEVYGLLKKEAELAFEISREQYPIWARWSRTNFFKTITKKGKDFEAKVTRLLRNRTPFKELYEEGFVHLTQISIKRAKVGVKRIVADDLFVKADVDSKGRSFWRAVINDTKLNKTSPWTKNQKSELLKMFADPRVKFIVYTVRTRRPGINSPIKQGDVIRIYRKDIYKTFGKGGKLEKTMNIGEILDDL